MRKTLVLVVIASLVLAFAGMALAKSTTPPAPKSFSAAQAAGVKATDPVSKHEFTISANSPHSQVQNLYYYFENAANKATFDASPDKYK